MYNTMTPSGTMTELLSRQMYENWTFCKSKQYTVLCRQLGMDYDAIITNKTANRWVIYDVLFDKWTKS